MEAWLAEPAWEPQADALRDWNAAFTRAKRHAARTGGWPAHADRARALGQRLQGLMEGVQARREALRHQLDAGVRGRRALVAYAPWDEVSRAGP
jgi:hypothetical protein